MYINYIIVRKTISHAYIEITSYFKPLNCFCYVVTTVNYFKSNMFCKIAAKIAKTYQSFVRDAILTDTPTH